MSDENDPYRPRWQADPANANLVRWWDGAEWNTSVSPQVALLNQVTRDNGKLKNEIDKIRYRVGFLALVVLVSLVFSSLVVISSIATLRNAGL